MTDARLERPLWRGRTNVDALTIGCIERAEQLVRQVHPELAHEFVITQGSYQGSGGDPNSAGTHALGGVVDIRWCGHLECILALRLAGMAGTWHRTPAQGPWPDHVHAVVYGHPNLAPLAARQITSVLSGHNGLANNGLDDGPRLKPFPPAAWPPIEEDDMPFTEKELRDIVRDETAKVVAAALDAPLNRNDAPKGDAEFRGWSVRRALKELLKNTGAVK